jgi:hypothetical protein
MALVSQALKPIHPTPKEAGFLQEPNNQHVMRYATKATREEIASLGDISLVHVQILDLNDFANVINKSGISKETFHYDPSTRDLYSCTSDPISVPNTKRQGAGL